MAPTILTRVQVSLNEDELKKLQRLGGLKRGAPLTDLADALRALLAGAGRVSAKSSSEDDSPVEVSP